MRCFLIKVFICIFALNCSVSQAFEGLLESGTGQWSEQRRSGQLYAVCMCNNRTIGGEESGSDYWDNLSGIATNAVAVIVIAPVAVKICEKALGWAYDKFFGYYAEKKRKKALLSTRLKVSPKYE